MAKTSAAEWARRLARLEASGLSATEFGRREGIDAQQLRWWKWHLERQRQDAPASAPVSFAPVVVHAEAMSSAVEVVLDSGRVVRVRSGFDEGAFTRVVALLEES